MDKSERANVLSLIQRREDSRAPDSLTRGSALDSGGGSTPRSSLQARDPSSPCDRLQFSEQFYAYGNPAHGVHRPPLNQPRPVDISYTGLEADVAT